MSYILDALRRAEAERERGAVPSLQSQQHTVIEEDDARAPRSRRMAWVVGGLGVALAAALAWNLFGGGSSPSTRPIAEGSVAATPAPVTAMPVPIEPALPTTAATAPPVALPTAPVTPATTTPAAVRAPLATSSTTPPRAATVSADEARRAARRGSETSALPSTVARAAPSASATGENRIYSQAELPEEIRRDLPRVAINGSSYSGDAASRMVMINGQVFHEGDRLAAGLVLEKINRRSAVLAFKGWRYEIAF
jgi:general secretion pathway protein B